MKRIVILSDKFPPLPGGGIASAHFNLYKMFRSKGFDVHVYTYLDENKKLTDIKDDPNVHRFGATELELKYLYLINKIKRKISNFKINKLPQKGLAYQLDLIKISNIGAKKINKQLKKFKPDIVFIPDFGVPGYSIQKLPNIKYVHISHNNPIRFINNPLIGIHSENDTTAALQADGDEVLNDHKPKQILTGRLLDTPGMQFGVHYQFGDIVTAQAFGYNVDCHISSVRVKVDQDNGEQIDVRLRGEL